MGYPGEPLPAPLREKLPATIVAQLRRDDIPFPSLRGINPELDRYYARKRQLQEVFEYLDNFDFEAGCPRALVPKEVPKGVRCGSVSRVIYFPETK